MKKIPVGKDGKFAIVDDQDYDRLREHKWHINQVGYVFTSIGGRVIYMHRLILGVPKGLEGHHRDDDTLNMCRKNLRICTHGQNMARRKMHRDNKIGYLGVTREKGKFLATICKDKKIYRLGTFYKPEEAAHAYDKAARDLHGDFARLNFPNEHQ